jgi:hypothetical protein
MNLSFLVVYDTVAFFGIAVVMFVMQKTEHDRINRLAPRPLREIRRLFFVATSFLLLFSIWDEASYRSLVALVFGGLLNFVVNAIALHWRTPPDDREGSREEMQRGFPAMGHYISRMDVERLDRGQLYIIELAEAILRNQELEPESAVIDPNPVIVRPAQFRPRQ